MVTVYVVPRKGEAPPVPMASDFYATVGHAWDNPDTYLRIPEGGDFTLNIDDAYKIGITVSLAGSTASWLYDKRTAGLVNVFIQAPDEEQP
jgi:hypothetical protein